MEYLVGALLALGVGVFATLVRLDRERGFYPVVVIVVASYYALFAVMGGSLAALIAEAPILCAFAAVAVLGFKGNQWLLVAALAGHGLLDLAHPHLVANPGVPTWWPMFCLTYDLVAAAYLAALILRDRRGPAADEADEAEKSGNCRAPQ
jgi:hypothetical protein